MRLRPGRMSASHVQSFAGGHDRPALLTHPAPVTWLPANRSSRGLAPRHPPNARGPDRPPTDTPSTRSSTDRGCPLVVDEVATRARWRARRNTIVCDNAAGRTTRFRRAALLCDAPARPPERKSSGCPSASPSAGPRGSRLPTGRSGGCRSPALEPIRLSGRGSGVRSRADTRRPTESPRGAATCSLRHGRSP